MANTRDGLAADRARGRKGGRPSKLSPNQIELAQQLDDAQEHAVAQIADMLKVPRTTVYGHLNKRVDVARVSHQPAPLPSVRTRATSIRHLWRRTYRRRTVAEKAKNGDLTKPVQR